MLPDNGKYSKKRNNYHMTLAELSLLLDHLQRYDPKWRTIVMTQFGMGLRASEVLAINLYDFSHDFANLTYRQAKTNKKIDMEPIPLFLRSELLHYISRNQHRFKDGYLFCCRNAGHKFIKTPVYGTYFSKWRNNLARLGHPEFLDSYTYEIIRCPKCNETWNEEDAAEAQISDKCPSCSSFLVTQRQKRFRVSSHSLRRLHRTVVSKNAPSDWIASKVCHYEDFATFLKYKNEFEIEETRKDLINHVVNPVLGNVINLSKGQKSLMEY
jgi:integrase